APALPGSCTQPPLPCIVGVIYSTRVELLSRTVLNAVGAVLVAKTIRTFSYGFLGILLPVYLADHGLDAQGVGLAVTCTLVGSAALTWIVRRPAERLGAGAALGVLAGRSAVAAGLMLV